MPRARRSKLVHLTNVKKQNKSKATGADGALTSKKDAFIAQITNVLLSKETAMNDDDNKLNMNNNAGFEYVYVVKVAHLRTPLLQGLREAMKPDTK